MAALRESSAFSEVWIALRAVGVIAQDTFSSQDLLLKQFQNSWDAEAVHAQLSEWFRFQSFLLQRASNEAAVSYESEGIISKSRCSHMRKDLKLGYVT